MAVTASSLIHSDKLNYAKKRNNFTPKVYVQLKLGRSDGGFWRNKKKEKRFNYVAREI